MTAALQRRLTLLHAVAIGLGSMIGAGVFTAIGLAAALTGGHPGLLYGALAVAAVAALCNALSTAQLATVHPESGGAYVYGRRQLHPWAGFVAGWGFVTGKTASVAAVAATLGLYLVPDDAAAARWTGVAAVVVLTGVAMAGVTRTAQATLAILVPVLAVLVLAIGAGLAREAPGGSAAALGVDSPVQGVLMGAGVLFFAFAGYARVATMGEEVIDPARTIPRAILIALAVTVALYLLLATALISGLGTSGLARSPAPVRDLLETALGSGWGWVAVAGAALAAAGAMLNLLTGISRTALAMARESDLPRPLARVHAGTGTPWTAQLTVAAAVILLLLTTDILTVVGFSSFGVLVYYAVANLSALTLRGDDDGRRPARPRPLRPLRVPRAVNVLGLALCLLLALSLPPMSVAAMAGVFLIGVGGRAFVRAGRRGR